MRNLLLVARREYLEQIRGRAFRLSTIALPALFALIFGVSYLSNLAIGKGKHVAVAAASPEIANAIRTEMLADSKESKDASAQVDVIAPYSAPDIDRLVKRVQSKEIDGFLSIDIGADGVPTARYTSQSSGDFIGTARLREALNHALLNQKLSGIGLQQVQVDALVKGIAIKTFKVDKQGRIVKSDALLSFWKGYVMAILLSMTTMIYGMNVARSIIQEKTSRIFEVMLSTAKPGDLLAGKLIGVGAVGLTQIGIWVLSASIFLGAGLAATLLSGDYQIQVSWVEGVLFPIYFVLGYLLYSSLFAGLAATCETEQELQMYMPLAALPVWLSFSLIILIINDPNSVWSIAASLFPPTAPIIMFLRMGSQIPPFWQFAASIGLMILSIYAVLWFATRLYRVGILMYGKRATLPELLKWLRYS